MAQLPDPHRIHAVQVRLLSGAAEIQQHDHGCEIYPAGRTVFEEGRGARITIRSGDGARGMVLERPAHCDDQLFVTAQDGNLLITDFFGAALSWLPLERRSVSDAALVDLLLFRTVPGTGTLLSAITRLGQGDRLEWSAEGAWTRRVQGPQIASVEPLNPELAIERLHEALEQATARRCSGAANLFSGGVDSTLLHCYLGRDVPAVTAVIDAPEFAPERAYAANGRSLLGTNGVEVAYREAEYRDRLHDTVRALRLPPHHLQTVSIDAAFSSPHACYYTAQFADALFGLGFAAHAQRAWRMRGIAALSRPLRLLPGAVGRKARTLDATLRALRTPAGRPGSYAQRFALYSDLPLMEQMFGAAAVTSRISARLAYTEERIASVSLAEQDGLESNLELGHWVDFFCDDTVALWGQLALSRGKRLIAPFTHAAVVRASTFIPPASRYARGGTAKYWPKRLLARQLPAYPANQVKYSSGLPFTRFYRSGPLAHALRDYTRPAFVPEPIWQTLDRDPGWLTWNVLTYLIWDAEVRGRTDGSPRAILERDYPLS